MTFAVAATAVLVVAVVAATAAVAVAVVAVAVAIAGATAVAVAHMRKKFIFGVFDSIFIRIIWGFAQGYCAHFAHEKFAYGGSSYAKKIYFGPFIFA